MSELVNVILYKHRVVYGVQQSASESVAIKSFLLLLWKWEEEEEKRCFVLHIHGVIVVDSVPERFIAFHCCLHCGGKK